MKYEKLNISFQPQHRLKLVLRPILTVTSVWNTGETGDINSLLIIKINKKMSIFGCFRRCPVFGSHRKSMFYKLIRK